MGAGGFEPPKAEPTGLQPVPFGRSGTPPGERHSSPEEGSHAPGYTEALALLAQLVEHLHGKEGVDGSSPSEGSIKGQQMAFFVASETFERCSEAPRSVPKTCPQHRGRRAKLA